MSGGNISSASDMLHVLRRIKMSNIIFLSLASLIHRTGEHQVQNDHITSETSEKSALA